MKSPTFAFDIDDVVFDSYSVIYGFLKSELGIDHANPSTFSIEKECGLTASTVSWVVDNALSDNDKIRPITGAIEFVKLYHLITKNPLIFITSRPSSLRQHTYDLLDTYIKGTPYKVYFPNARGITKGDIAKENEIEVFVDDRIKYCLQISQQGILAIMMSKSWNFSFNNEMCSHRIVRVKNWDDVHLIFGTLLHYNR